MDMFLPLFVFAFEIARQCTSSAINNMNNQTITTQIDILHPYIAQFAMSRYTKHGILRIVKCRKPYK